MKTTEEILNEIQVAMISNNELKRKSNIALNDALSLILHNQKELQERLDEEYKRGMNDAWEIAREIHSDYNKFTNIYGEKSTINYVIQNSTPLEVKEKIATYRKEINKIHVGDVVQNKNNNIKATILDRDHNTNFVLMDEKYWMVFTENGCVESWCENEFTKTNKSVDVYSVLMK